MVNSEDTCTQYAQKSQFISLVTLGIVVTVQLNWLLCMMLLICSVTIGLL